MKHCESTDLFMSFARGLAAAQQITGKRDVPIQHLMVLMEVIDIALRRANTKKGNPVPERTAKALAKPWKLRPDGISKVLKALEADYGYVVSEIDSEDRRNRLYFPTTHGRDFAIRWARLSNGTDFSKVPMEIRASKSQVQESPRRRGKKVKSPKPVVNPAAPGAVTRVPLSRNRKVQSSVIG